LRLPEGWTLPSLEGGWVKVPDVPLPSVPRPLMSFRGPGRLSLPAAPAVSPRDAGQALVGLLFLAGVAALLALAATRLRSRIAARAAMAWQLGPWPVHPGQVASRRDLVLAFEHLALSRLGPGARSRNHRDLAEGLVGGRVALVGAADHLADLYEQARYAPDEGPLPAAALADARRNLCLLAGVAGE
jgi:hypothetical protein